MDALAEGGQRAAGIARGTSSKKAADAADSSDAANLAILSEGCVSSGNDWTPMTLAEIVVVLLALLALRWVPYASTVGLLALAAWALLCLIRFYMRFVRLNPSVWQMRRRARRAAGAPEEYPEAGDGRGADPDGDEG